MNKTIGQNKLWTGSFIKICLVNFFIFRKLPCIVANLSVFRYILRRRCLDDRSCNSSVQRGFHCITTLFGLACRYQGQMCRADSRTYRNGSNPHGIFRLLRNSLCHYPQNSTRIVPCSLKQCLLDMGCRHHTLRANGRGTRNVRTFNGTIDRNHSVLFHDSIRSCRSLCGNLCFLMQPPHRRSIFHLYSTCNPCNPTSVWQNHRQIRREPIGI